MSRHVDRTGCRRHGLPTHITHEATRETVQQGYAVATVKPEEIAEVIAFALAQPATWSSTRSCSVPQSTQLTTSSRPLHQDRCVKPFGAKGIARKVGTRQRAGGGAGTAYATIVISTASVAAFTRESEVDPFASNGEFHAVGCSPWAMTRPLSPNW